MSNFDQYNQVENPSLVLCGGDFFAFYANLDELEDSASFSDWHLDLVMQVGDGFNLVVEDIGTLFQDVISGSNYRFYSSFNIPYDLTTGCYRLVITDEFYNLVQYVSRPMNYKSHTDYSIPIRYRNNINILNYNYQNTLSSFYNTFRLNMVKRQPLNEVNQVGYDLIDGSFFPISTVTGLTEEFILSFADEYHHQGFEAATIHSDFEIGTKTGWKQFVRKSEYQVDWQEDYPLADGIIRLQQKNSFSSNKTQ